MDFELVTHDDYHHFTIDYLAPSGKRSRVIVSQLTPDTYRAEIEGTDHVYEGSGYDPLRKVEAYLRTDER